MKKATTCCFIGPQNLPKDKIEYIVMCLNQKIDILINKGIKTFITGGAFGLDQIAASLVIVKKRLGMDIRLILVLPCKNLDGHCSVEQKKLYQNLLAEVDGLIYMSEEYTDGCMEKRDSYMVDNSAYCICANGMEQAAKYAKQRGLTVINVLEMQTNID